MAGESNAKTIANPQTANATKAGKRSNATAIAPNTLDRRSMILRPKATVQAPP